MLPIMLVALAYVSGILGGLCNYCIIPFFLVLCLIIRKSNNIIAMVCILFFVFGIFYTISRSSCFDNKYKSGIVEFEAKIDTDIVEKGNTNSCVIKNTYGDKFILYFNKEIKIDYGMIISLSGELSVPSTSRNRRSL